MPKKCMLDSFLCDFVHKTTAKFSIFRQNLPKISIQNYGHLAETIFYYNLQSSSRKYRHMSRFMCVSDAFDHF